MYAIRSYYAAADVEARAIERTGGAVERGHCRGRDGHFDERAAGVGPAELAEFGPGRLSVRGGQRFAGPAGEDFAGDGFERETHCRANVMQRVDRWNGEVTALDGRPSYNFV